MSLKSIRAYYGVPAYRGRHVTYTGGKTPKIGRIVGASGHYLKLAFYCPYAGKEIVEAPFHPTWQICYTPDAGPTQAYQDSHGRPGATPEKGSTSHG